MVGLAFVIFTLLDGAVRNNTAIQAAPWRAGLVAALALALMVWAYKARVRVGLPGAALIGVLAAYSISESHHRCCGVGISTWLIVSAVYAVQRVTKHDWLNDASIAGVILACIVLAGGIVGRAPGGMLNRNMLAGALAALAPAVYARWPLAGALVITALVASGSRGAMVAGLVGAAVLVRPWRQLGRAWEWMAAPSYVALVIGLWAIRPRTMSMRLACAGEVLAEYWRISPMFGLGPGFEMGLSWGDTAINAHNAYLTILAISGIVGVVILLAAIALLSRQIRFSFGWQLASLAAIATHAIVEENTSWWPVMVVLGIAAADALRGDNDN